MLKKGFALMLLVAIFALASTGGSQDNGIGEGLFIDGPGGYLPDIDADVGSLMNFDQTPSRNNEVFSNYLIIYGELLNILNYWENYLRLFLG